MDENGLKAALENGFETKGFCVSSSRNENGILINPLFSLFAADTDKPIERTELNVMAAEATIILYRKDPTLDGTIDTIYFVKKHKKPHLVLDGEMFSENGVDVAVKWLSENRFCSINIAGPRESSDPGIGEAAFNFFSLMFYKYRNPSVPGPMRQILGKMK